MSSRLTHLFFLWAIFKILFQKQKCSLKFFLSYSIHFLCQNNLLLSSNRSLFWFQFLFYCWKPTVNNFMLMFAWGKDENTELLARRKQCSPVWQKVFSAGGGYLWDLWTGPRQRRVVVLLTCCWLSKAKTTKLYVLFASNNVRLLYWNKHVSALCQKLSVELKM